MKNIILYETPEGKVQVSVISILETTAADGKSYKTKFSYRGILGNCRWR
jgi:hypothetical protein